MQSSPVYPAAHEQLEAPAAEIALAAQGLQVAELVCDVEAENLPATQSVQIPSDSYLPALQAAHAQSGANLMSDAENPFPHHAVNEVIVVGSVPELLPAATCHPVGPTWLKVALSEFWIIQSPPSQYRWNLREE